MVDAMSDKTGELVGELYQRAAEQIFALKDAVTTELLQAARAMGCRAVGGLGMLVNQGALAFELWFEEERKKLKYDPLELRRLMRGAAENALKEKP
jgi:shikimate 5-dehydrogenase